MFKFAALISILLVIGAESQRPWYAGSSNRYPQVLPQFENKENTNVGSRVGEDDNSVSSSGPTTSTTPSPLPFDEMGYAETVQKVKDLPESQQPFWYVNRHQIAEHLNPVGGTSQDNINQSGVQTRSFFAG